VIAHCAQKLFPTESGAVFVFRSSLNLVEAIAVWGEPSSAKEFAPDRCWALQRGKEHWVEYPSSQLLCPHLTAPPPASYLCVPMAAMGELLGLVHLRAGSLGMPASGGEAALSEARRRLVRAAADQIALALANLKLRERLREQAIRDPLTGLYNRRYLEETLERELNRAKRRNLPLGVIMLDIDHFKRFNDTFGHEGGDVLLRELGQFLQTSVRREDIACRYGGEEFTLVLPEVSLEMIQQRAETLRAGARELNVRYRGQTLSAITVSLGAAAYPEHGATAETLVRAADGALYRAKREGRDRVAVRE
jgi:diguanylate cyclase (GGDEF)-like protein